ncbi:YihY/virulence factor BrkB family protein [Flavobacterium lindanitolerans]|jgi:membrane protein|uniref:Membrane protein n=1 Tax=Flavobacterium lindanitolerans TaxID=428988 RepID=A0A497U3M7_9FLAO|nr:YihY/virulence factor BrkB family protein [Flavobacterium lindanitolerans]PKW30097.1 membrane protein [Flavobacterium lindanitolerans]RLJ24437.1 membrane protein [Flavobacterium lindanitolerans]THD33798.1 MAG: YihY/virulence factor BrkB family protein [Flavobacterium johnsoniae]
MKSKGLFSKTWYLLKNTISEFNDDNAIKLSASLSYYTIFAIPPLMIIIITLCGFFFGKDAVTGELYGQINRLVGNDAAIQIQNAIKNVELSDSNAFAAIFGGVMLLIGASGVFAEIQSSINFIWGLKAKPNKGFKKFIQNRLMSFSMIVSVGFLLLVSLLVNSVMDLLSAKLRSYFQEGTIYIFYVLNLLLVFAIITLLFTIIFRTLPDGKIRWKDAFIGSSFTAVLFMVGKFAIGLYLGNSTVASVYGAAGSIIIILVWVYYSAIILYFGAEFTKVYAKAYGGSISPNEYSVEIQKEIFEITDAETNTKTRI